MSASPAQTTNQWLESRDAMKLLVCESKPMPNMPEGYPPEFPILPEEGDWYELDDKKSRRRWEFNNGEWALMWTKPTALPRSPEFESKNA